MQLIQTLQTTKFELNYERSSRIVEGIAKDEDIRKLRFKIAVMEDEIEELNEQLAKEEERADEIAQDLEDAVAHTGELDATVQQLNNELRLKTRELEAAEVGTLCLLSNCQLIDSTGRGVSHEWILKRQRQSPARKACPRTRAGQSQARSGTPTVPSCLKPRPSR